MTAIVVVDTSTGEVVSEPEITSRGVAEDQEVFDRVRPQVEKAVVEAMAKGTTDTYALQQVVRNGTGTPARWDSSKKMYWSSRLRPCTNSCALAVAPSLRL